MRKIIFAAIALLFPLMLFAQKPELSSLVTKKWRVIWFSDDGVVKNMEAKKQQLHLRPDGSGSMYMMGEVVGPAKWAPDSKKTILFSDDPDVEPYPVKVKFDKDMTHMTLSAVMPNGVKRVVHMEVLSGKP